MMPRLDMSSCSHSCHRSQTMSPLSSSQANVMRLRRVRCVTGGSARQVCGNAGATKRMVVAQVSKMTTRTRAVPFPVCMGAEFFK